MVEPPCLILESCRKGSFGKAFSGHILKKNFKKKNCTKLFENKKKYVQQLSQPILQF